MALGKTEQSGHTDEKLRQRNSNDRFRSSCTFAAARRFTEHGTLSSSRKNVRRGILCFHGQRQNTQLNAIIGEIPSRRNTFTSS